MGIFYILLICGACLGALAFIIALCVMCKGRRWNGYLIHTKKQQHFDFNSLEIGKKKGLYFADM